MNCYQYLNKRREFIIERWDLEFTSSFTLNFNQIISNKKINRIKTKISIFHPNLAG